MKSDLLPSRTKLLADLQLASATSFAAVGQHHEALATLAGVFDIQPEVPTAESVGALLRASELAVRLNVALERPSDAAERRKAVVERVMPLVRFEGAGVLDAYARTVLAVLAYDHAMTLSRAQRREQAQVLLELLGEVLPQVRPAGRPTLIAESKYQLAVWSFEAGDLEETITAADEFLEETASETSLATKRERARWIRSQALKRSGAPQAMVLEALSGVLADATDTSDQISASIAAGAHFERGQILRKDEKLAEAAEEFTAASEARGPRVGDLELLRSRALAELLEIRWKQGKQEETRSAWSGLLEQLDVMNGETKLALASRLARAAGRVGQDSACEGAAMFGDLVGVLEEERSVAERGIKAEALLGEMDCRTRLQEFPEVERLGEEFAELGDAALDLIDRKRSDRPDGPFGGGGAGLLLLRAAVFERLGRVQEMTASLTDVVERFGDDDAQDAQSAVRVAREQLAAIEQKDGET